MSQQPQQTVPSAPDSPALVVTSNVQKYAIKKKKVLNAEEMELFELTQAAGITVDQEVFKIIVDLLKMNVAPQAVFQTLKAMCAGQRVADSNGGESSTISQTTSIPTAPAEAREEDSLVSGKSPKPPAAPPSASGPRATRVNTKIVVYGPQDTSSPHAQGSLCCTVSYTSICLLAFLISAVYVYCNTDQVHAKMSCCAFFIS
ncbi:mitotic-spindle organizing protein 2 isoform X1 [Anabas testudineus]|uniref:mitotic-spindle organizing protein 2 isoform X1 n=1 Tax=Anabas testudineus TaxID=64144 RepID=UPI000E457818|nr:mitotic-spindle organizing protein 2 isoform X1 [Anabas testudineus]